MEALYATLARKVAWPMNLYVQYYNPEGFDYRAALPNSNIRFRNWRFPARGGKAKIRDF